MIGIERVRRLRLMLKTMWWLSNWREVWRRHRSGETPPPLRFRSGLTLTHGSGDGPVFLLFEVFSNGCYRRHVGRPTAGTVVDIGANIGAFALDCVWGAPAVHVHAFEPGPHVYDRLCLNVRANGLDRAITTHNVAVARGRGTMTLHVGGPSLTATGYGDPGPAAGNQSVEVPAIGLADVVELAGGAVQLLKIDAEGAEADILEGAPPEALGAIDRVVVECHDWLTPDALGRSKRALDDAGFACRVRQDRRCGSMLYARRRRRD